MIMLWVVFAALLALIWSLATLRWPEYLTWRRGIMAPSWHRVKGSIISSHIKEIKEYGDYYTTFDTVLYEPIVEYVYVVANNEYRGSDIGSKDSKKGYRKYGKAREVMDKYPIGAPVQVMFNPEDPGVSALEAEPIQIANFIT
jgi:hypothetical protein